MGKIFKIIKKFDNYVIWAYNSYDDNLQKYSLSAVFMIFILMIFSPIYAPIIRLAIKING